MFRKDKHIADMEKSKKELETKYSKARTKPVGRSSLSRGKHILWDQLSIEITKFGLYLNLIEDEQNLVNNCNQICR